MEAMGRLPGGTRRGASSEAGKMNLGVAGEGSANQSDLDRSEAKNADWPLATRVDPTIAQ